MRAPQRLRRVFRSPARHSILTAGRNCWRIARAEASGLLIDGRDYYRAFYHAASAAERYILMSGWQFDSNVALLRGADTEDGQGPYDLLDFLNTLCERNPNLTIYMLAWDHSMLYSLDREWFQDWYFNWSTNERLTFCFDRASAFDASHHQKFVVIDGVLAFVGGLDLCASRWDERDHRSENPLRRDSNGAGYRTFHDLQSYHTGPVARLLAQHFQQRWQKVCGKALDLPAVQGSRAVTVQPTVDIGAAHVAISRTEVDTANGSKPIREIRQLFLDAIDAAERSIFIENQYCSSEALASALVERMQQRRRPRLQIVLVLAKDAEAFLEQLSIGIAQSRILRRLRDTAAQTGHDFGIYYPASAGAGDQEVPTYIHSKLLSVDDRFLSVGSANMNNRSMGYDTELNIAWDDLPGSVLSERIRDARIELLAEHCGVEGAARERLGAFEGLVDYLNRLADSGQSRLRHHPARSASEEQRWLTTFLPDGLPFDAEITGAAETTPGIGTTRLTRGLNSLGRLFHREREA